MENLRELGDYGYVGSRLDSAMTVLELLTTYFVKLNDLKRKVKFCDTIDALTRKVI